MKNYQWPYPNINQADFLSQIISVEKILQKYGAEFIGDSCEMGRWILSDGSDAYEKIEKKIWKRMVPMKMQTHFHTICLTPN